MEIKNIITNKGLLMGAGIGAATGLIAAHICGVSKTVTAIMLAAVGGAVGYSGTGEAKSSFTGDKKKNVFRQPSQQSI